MFDGQQQLPVLFHRKIIQPSPKPLLYLVHCFVGPEQLPSGALLTSDAGGGTWLPCHRAHSPGAGVHIAESLKKS